MAEFTGMIWVIILHEYKLFSHKPRFGWDRVMLQYDVITSLIQFAFHLVQTLDLTIGKSSLTPTRGPSCFTVGVI